MGTFMAIFLVAFLEFMELSMASMADKKVNNIEKNGERYERASGRYGKTFGRASGQFRRR